MLLGQQVARPRRYFRCFLLATVLAGLPTRIAAQQPKTTDAVYSETQATRGEALYGKYCRSCHGAQLTGTEFGPGITGAEFKARWLGGDAEFLC